MLAFFGIRTGCAGRMDEDTKRLFCWLGILGVGVTLIVIGLYVYTFAPLSGYQLSHDGADWAHFGEYAAGTLGPLFALLAVVGVVITVREQQRGSLLEEFQRQFAIQSQRVESLLAEEPAETNPAITLLIGQLAPSKSIASLLKRIGLHVMREPDKDSNIQEQNDTLHRAALPAMKRQLNAIQIELQHLIWCLGNYRDNGGSETLVALYTRRYEPFVCEHSQLF